MSPELRPTRRELIATAGGATAVAMAGCGALNDDGGEEENGESEADDDSENGDDEEPSIAVSTGEARTVGSMSGVLSGSLESMGEYGTVDCYFEYREAGGEWTETGSQSLSEPAEFSAELGGLSTETEYEFRAAATVGGTTVTGETQSFTTRPDPDTAQITTDNLTLLYEEDGADRITIAQAAVENVGGGNSAPISFEITWYDDERTELGTDTATLETLRPGETWLVQVTPQNVDDEAVGSVTSTTTVEGRPPNTPSGLSVTDTELRTDNYPTELHGIVESSRDAETSTEVIARVFDEEDNVIGDGRASVSNIPAGGSRPFTANFYRRDAERIEADFEYEVILDS